MRMWSSVSAVATTTGVCPAAPASEIALRRQRIADPRNGNPGKHGLPRLHHRPCVSQVEPVLLQVARLLGSAEAEPHRWMMRIDRWISKHSTPKAPRVAKCSGANESLADFPGLSAAAPWLGAVTPARSPGGWRGLHTRPRPAAHFSKNRSPMQNAHRGGRFARGPWVGPDARRTAGDQFFT